MNARDLISLYILYRFVVSYTQDTHTHTHMFVFMCLEVRWRWRESPLRKTAIKSAHRAPVGTHHFRRLKTVAAADRLAIRATGSRTHKYSFQIARNLNVSRRHSSAHTHNVL